MTRKLFEDDDLCDDKGLLIIEVTPAPTNIIKVPKLDDFVEEDWRDKKALVESDHDLARVQDRIRDVMGLLSKVWLTLQDIQLERDREIEMEERRNGRSTQFYCRLRHQM